MSTRINCWTGGDFIYYGEEGLSFMGIKNTVCFYYIRGAYS